MEKGLAFVFLQAYVRVLDIMLVRVTQAEPLTPGYRHSLALSEKRSKHSRAAVVAVAAKY